MKKLIVTFSLLITLAPIAFSQNTFPSSGNVGIGTSSPGQLLTIQSDAALIHLQSATAPTGYFTDIMNSYASQYPFYINVNNIGRMGFKAVGLITPTDIPAAFISGFYGVAFATGAIDPTNGNIKMAILQNGNVGIGSTSPASKLHLYQSDNGNSTSTGITIEQGGTGNSLLQFLQTGVQRWSMGIDNTNSQSFKIATGVGLGTADKFTILTSGNVGIGTTSPTQKLQVLGEAFFPTSSTSPDPGDGSGTGLRIGYTSVYDFGFINAGNTGIAVKPLVMQLNGGSVNIGNVNTILAGATRISVDVGSSTGINNGIFLNSQHGFGSGVGTAASAVTFTRNRLTDNTAVNYESQIIGGNINETTAAGGYLAFLTSSNATSLAEHMRIDNNGNVGIGSTTPASLLHLESANFPLVSIVKTGIGTWKVGNFDQSTDNGFTIGLNAAKMVYINTSGNVGINTLTTNGYMFAVNGTAIATAMTVKAYANWPDYVFEKDFKLMPLDKVKTYIDLNHHLPEMPSQQQVEKDGLNLGEINKLLTKKVEELTLYLIDNEQKQKEQENALKRQQAEIEQLKVQMQLLMKNSNK